MMYFVFYDFCLPISHHDYNSIILELFLSWDFGLASRGFCSCVRHWVQGHLNCMLHFATGFLRAGLHVTFFHTVHNLRRLGGAAAASSSPRLRFLSVPDGLPDDHPGLVDSVPELLDSLWTRTSASYRALLWSPLCRGRSSDDGFPPVTCVVADGVLRSPSTSPRSSASRRSRSAR
jgi:hypothetical protein